MKLPEGTSPARASPRTGLLTFWPRSRSRRSGGCHAPRVSAGRVHAVLAWLDANGGQLNRTELAIATGVAAGRLGGLVATLARCLNLDGYSVLADDGERVVFDARLAKKQFGTL